MNDDYDERASERAAPATITSTRSQGALVQQVIGRRVHSSFRPLHMRAALSGGAPFAAATLHSRAVWPAERAPIESSRRASDNRPLGVGSSQERERKREKFELGESIRRGWPTLCLSSALTGRQTGGPNCGQNKRENALFLWHTYSSKSVSRDESRKPLAKGFESILSFVML